MKRFILLTIAALMLLPSTAEAKRRESEEEIALKTRHYSGWEWGATGRVALIFYEQDYMHIKGQPAVAAYKTQVKVGGNIMVGGGYFLNNHWRIGFETGAQIQYNYTFMPLYLTGHYFYGTRKNALFNFVHAGTNILFNKGLRFGATCAGGVGVRLQSPDSELKYDIMLGYDFNMLSPRPVIKEPFGYKKRDVKRHALNQSVFIGLGISF